LATTTAKASERVIADPPGLERHNKVASGDGWCSHRSTEDVEIRNDRAFRGLFASLTQRRFV